MHPGVWALCALLAGTGDVPSDDAAAPAARPAGTTTSVFVLRFETLAADPEKGDLVQGLVVQELTALDGLHVTSYRDMQNVMTREQLGQLLDCTENSCAAEVAQALNSDELVTGTLARFGDGHMLSLTRMDGRTARVLARQTTRLPSLNASSAIRALRRQVSVLFARSPPSPPVEEDDDLDAAPAARSRSRGPGEPGAPASSSLLLAGLPALASATLCATACPPVVLSVLASVLFASTAQSLGAHPEYVGALWMWLGCGGGAFIASVATLAFSGILGVLSVAAIPVEEIRSRATSGTLLLLAAWVAALGAVSFAVSPFVVLYASNSHSLLATSAGDVAFNCLVISPCCACSLGACGVGAAAALAGVITEVTRARPVRSPPRHRRTTSTEAE